MYVKNETRHRKKNKNDIHKRDVCAPPSVSMDPVSVSVLRVSCLCNIAQSFVFILEVLLILFLNLFIYLDAIGYPFIF